MLDAVNGASGGHITSLGNRYTQFKLAAPIPYHPLLFNFYESSDISAGQVSFSIQMWS